MTLEQIIIIRKVSIILSISDQFLTLQRLFNKFIKTTCYFVLVKLIYKILGQARYCAAMNFFFRTKKEKSLSRYLSRISNSLLREKPTY